MKRIRTLTQLVAVVHDTGDLFGIVVDPRPMTNAESTWHARAMGARCIDGASAIAAELGHRYKSNVTVAELVHVPGQQRLAGRQVRTYQPRTHYRVVVRVTCGTESEAA
jgi:hypothetical protein